MRMMTEAVVDIRKMEEADIEKIIVIEQASYPFPWTRGIFRDCLKAGYEAWLMESAGECLAYGLLSVAAGEAHILNLCVNPDYRSHGYGKKMLKRLLDVAMWHLVEEVFLEVRPSNEAALALYRKMGFYELARRPNYYPAGQDREDAIIMARRVRFPAA